MGHALVQSEDLSTATLRHVSVKLVVEDNTQEGIVDVDLAVVLDEAQFPEFVHEKIDPGPRCANHLRQHLLRNFGEHFLRRSGADREWSIKNPAWPAG